MMLRLPSGRSVPERAVRIDFVRSPGPGGQHVNKASTAAQLRFDLDHAGLPPAVAARLRELARARITREGELIIEAHRFRSQQRNREDALARLAALLERASQPPKPRIRRGVPASAKRKRREAKRERGRVKRLRGRPRVEE